MKIKKGLQNVVALDSSISRIDGPKMDLSYRGWDIKDLADNYTFEQVMYLLWYERFPTMKQLKLFKSQLRRQYKISKDTIKFMRSLPKSAPPMAVLRSLVSFMALKSPEGDVMDKESNLKRALSLTAKMPILMANWYRMKKGKKFMPALGKYTIAENFLFILEGKEPDPKDAHIFEKCLILHADHGLNASTFAARVTVATLSDFHSGVVSAIGALKGPLHGGANEQVAKMWRELKNPDAVKPYIVKKLKKKEKIMGFGHRVYSRGDPRAWYLKYILSKMHSAKAKRLLDMSIEAEHVMMEKKIRPNVDFYSASVYTVLGIPSELFTPIFACSRVTGWSAHIMEQYKDNRLIRPRARYVGKMHSFL